MSHHGLRAGSVFAGRGRLSQNERMGALVGVISDTHGLLREEAVRRLAGVDLIIHAGDVGSQEVLEALGKIAPVHAVRGNVDTETWARRLPERRIVEVEGCRILVLHKIADLGPEAAAGRFHAVIYGHSHKYAEERRDGRLYLNPGSAGPRRFRLPISLARVTVEGDVIGVERVELGVA